MDEAFCTPNGDRPRFSPANRRGLSGVSLLVFFTITAACPRFPVSGFRSTVTVPSFGAHGCVALESSPGDSPDTIPFRIPDRPDPDSFRLPGSRQINEATTTVKIPYSASDNVRKALLQLGRTEDVKVSPNGGRIAIAGFNRDEILLLDLKLESAGGRRKLALTNAIEISCAALAKPHGLAFIDESLVIVANREGDMPLLRLPPPGTAGDKLEVQAHEVIRSDLWLHSPGSVCCYEMLPGQHQVLVCNNYANYVTRHTLEVNGELAATKDELLLARGLEIPDGVAISSSGRWIAVSNHMELPDTDRFFFPPAEQPPGEQ